MGMIRPEVVAMVLVAATIVPAWLMASARAPVHPQRVARFARRQHLTVTPGNGNQVIRYLATTRRWRVAGLIVAYGLWLAWASSRPALQPADSRTVSINFSYLLAAWFVGAVIAEARLATRPAGARRSASLVPREPADYLSRLARLAMPVALAASLLVAAGALVAAIGRDLDPLPAVVGLAATVLVAAIIWQVRRQVLGRPQPADLLPDQLAADDAIRSRSLHVLAGAGVALILYAVGYQLEPLVADPPEHAAAEWLTLLRILAVVAAPVLGWLIATTSWAVQRPAAQPTQPA